MQIEGLIMQNETFYAWNDTFHVFLWSVLHIACTMGSVAAHFLYYRYGGCIRLVM